MSNICECCWTLGKTYKVEKGSACMKCINKLKLKKEVDING